MTDQEKTLASFILNRRYFLKLYRKPKSKWRRLIANEYVESGLSARYPTSMFCEVWEQLDKIGLI